MPVEPKSVASLEEFRLLYYPDADPTLDYFDGVGPERVDEAEPAEDLVADPLDRFAHALHFAD